jgi:hypothetical protein
MYNKIIIECPEHGSFAQTPGHHIYNKNGCPSCAGSNAQNELSCYIEDLNFEIIKDCNNIISPYELDIFILEKNIAIEYNELYWHSEQSLLKRGIEKPKKYHLNKLEECKKNKIRLIQIFEDEWKYKRNIVENRLSHILNLNNNIIGARKTFIKEIPAKQKNIFLESHHIQGKDTSSIKLGAFYNDKLVGVMTFCKPRIAMGQKSRKYGVYELSRFAVEFEHSFPGLANKMFKHFTRNYDVNEVFTYSDKRWNIGNIYLKLGMKFEYSTKPNYFYIVNNKRVHRFNFRKQEIKNKLSFFDPNLTEYQNMLENKYDRIWDCGNDKYNLSLK